MVIANASCNGNWQHLSLNGKLPSAESNMMHGMKAVLPLKSPEIIQISIMCCDMLITTPWVPLQSPVTLENPDVICEFRISRILMDPLVVSSCLRSSGLWVKSFV